MICSRGFWLLCSLSVAFVAFGDAASARAGCGDYVMAGAEQKHSNAGHLHRAAPPSQEAPLPGRSPCQGPGCSQHHLPIAPPASMPIPSAEERWGQAVVMLAASSPASLFLSLDFPAAHSVRGCTSIYHPPR
jgi:hypothetical protein